MVIKNIDKFNWTASSYIIRSNWVRIKNGFVWMPIPKNASTSIRQILGFRNTVKSDTIDLTKTKNFTIIREPIDRFVAGFIEGFYKRDANDFRYKAVLDMSIKKEAEMSNRLDELKSKNLTDEDNLVNYLNLISEYGFFEGHIMPQTKFIEYCIGDTPHELQDFINTKLNIFKIENLSKFYEFMGVNNMAVKNPTKGHLSSMKNKLLNFVYGNDGVLGEIKKIYVEDLKLYGSFDDNKLVI